MCPHLHLPPCNKMESELTRLMYDSELNFKSFDVSEFIFMRKFQSAWSLFPNGQNSEHPKLEYKGINSNNKWLALSNKIEECGFSIICLQETKKEHFDGAYLKNFFPRKLNFFDFVPYV